MTSDQVRQGAPRAWPVAVQWESVDRHRLLTLLAVGGLVVGGLMAILGMPPFDSHGPLYHLGIMSPICGGTRAVVYAMRGELGLSWAYNPAGVPLVAGAVLVAVRHLVGTVSHRWLTVRVTAWRLAIVVAAALLVALQIKQQLHASFLLAS